MKLIKINTDHYIIVDDSGIKEGDWFLNTVQRNIYCNNIPNYDVNKDYLKKITHSTQPLEEGTTIHDIEHKRWILIKYIDLQEIKELIGEVDVERKMISPYPINTQNDVDWCNGYQRGYNQALEDNKEKKYTEEDLRRYHNIMCLHGNVKGEEYIQSLQPKTEWEVEIVDGKLKLL